MQPVAEFETSILYEDYLSGTVVDRADAELTLVDNWVDLSPLRISLLFAARFAGSAAFELPPKLAMKKTGTYRTQVILGFITTTVAGVTIRIFEYFKNLPDIDYWSSLTHISLEIT